MMKVLVVSEGKHEIGTSQEPGGSLSVLVERLLGSSVDIKTKKISDNTVRMHTPKGSGSNLEKRFMAWMNYAKRKEFQAVVILTDQDGKRERQSDIDGAQQLDYPDIPRACGLAIRQYDAWMLADETALSSVLDKTIGRQPDPEGIRDPKSCCQQLRDSSTIEINLTDMYRQVAENLDLDILIERCPNGFKPFSDRVKSLSPSERN